ncbi:ABC transporter permease [Niveispirillum sp. KHB5.9]|uniref:ABC transporter permease n=1 Tax=Niveispirillum sp. KHB5.9 TaxID=3400269 RepID=UPI003A84AD7C
MSQYQAGRGSGGRGWYGGFVADGRPSMAAALSDMMRGLASWRIWLTLAMGDVRQKYRGSILGPLWVTISMAAFTVGIGAVYANLFNIDIHAYLPHVAIGMVTWTLITGLVNESCTALIGAEGYLRQMRLPQTVFVYRVVARNAVVLLHHALIIVGVLIWFAVPVSPVDVLLAVLALLLLLVTGYGWGLALACICMRFRDVAQIVATLITGAFFITPVLWKGSFLADGHPALRYNPFYYLVEILRQPLTTGHSDPLHWLVSVFIALSGLLVGLLIFRASRPRVAYWI